MRRLSLVLAGLIVLTALLAHAPARAEEAGRFPDEIALPNGWLPEGIATGHGSAIYSGSRANGAIYVASLRTGKGRILVPGVAGRVAVGLSFDGRSNYLFVAGGATGKAYVYDTDTGALVQEYTLTAPGSFVNDVIVTKRAAYVTDSRLPVYYRIPLGYGGTLADPADVETVPLSGDWEQLDGVTNANGIEATRNGNQLIIVNTTVGALYRVEPLTGVATRINLGGASVSAGDGLLLHDRVLYVVRNRLNEIAVIRLGENLRRGTLVRTITSPNFDVPTTIAAFRDSLYVVNARFTTPPTPDTPYNIVRVPTDH